MPRKIIALEELFEIIGKTDGVDFHDVIGELKEFGGMDISVDKVELVEKFDRHSHLFDNCQYFIVLKFFLTEIFPSPHSLLRHLHLQENQPVFNDLVLLYLLDVLVFHLSEEVDNLKGFLLLLLEE